MTTGLWVFTDGLGLILDPNVLLMLAIGVIAGIIAGALPGLTATMAVAVMIPLTYHMSPVAAFALLIGTWLSAIFGGSIGAILINIPGTSAAIMTTLDGYPMAKSGEAGRAIGIATVCSFVGGLVSAVFLALFAPVVALWALGFGSWEYAALAIFGLGMVVYISPSIPKGILAGLFGLLLSTIGTDPMTAFPRYVFGQAYLLNGLELVPVMIGLFGLAEVLAVLERQVGTMKPIEQVSRVFPSFLELRRLLPTILRALPVGLVVGVTPAAGPTIATITAYGLEKRFSRQPERFGKGAPEGIAAAETANNASTGGDMVPMMTLGIPGDAVTAVLIGALLLHGLRPGPQLFMEHRDVVSAIFLLMILANIGFLVVGLAGCRLFVQILKTPLNILIPTIGVLMVVGTFAIRNSVFDVGVLLLLGGLGYLMGKVNVATAPVILGLILGPMLESNLRRALVIAGGDPSTFFLRPVSALLLLATVLLLSSRAMLACWTRWRAR